MAEQKHLDRPEPERDDIAEISLQATPHLQRIAKAGDDGRRESNDARPRRPARRGRLARRRRTFKEHDETSED